LYFYIIQQTNLIRFGLIVPHPRTGSSEALVGNGGCVGPLTSCQPLIGEWNRISTVDDMICSCK